MQQEIDNFKDLVCFAIEIHHDGMRRVLHHERTQPNPQTNSYQKFWVMTTFLFFFFLHDKKDQNELSHCQERKGPVVTFLMSITGTIIVLDINLEDDFASTVIALF